MTYLKYASGPKATSVASTDLAFLGFNYSDSSSHYLGFPGGSDCKASACNAGDPGSIAGSERSPGEGNGNPLQSSCLENAMDREAIHGVTKS